MSTSGELPFDLPKVTASQRKRALRLGAMLKEHYPDAHCELNYKSAHELLVATILSAQTTDAGVNKATPALFARFPTPADYAAATPTDIEPLIRSLGFFRNKARAIHSSMTDVVNRFGGQVPRTMAELLTLHGVARKTANVVLGNAHGVNQGIPVDTHVERLSQRLGLVPRGTTVPMIERYLMALFPREDWCAISHMLIWHGRRACKARLPACSDHPICREFGDRCDLRVPTPARPTKTKAAPTRRRSGP
ncbi:Ultraviolet N-glycosylase/AP lyase [Phycisphaerales bacterium]|nr:Ultraviolet N-glycosylase/AP lyase [Phycisphaerales bacterium]